MKIAFLGMTGEYDKESISISGINKYMYSTYSEIQKMKGIEINKIEYKKVAKKFPWANHLAFFFQSWQVGNGNYDIVHNPNGIRPYNFFFRNKKVKLITTIHDLMPVTNRARSSNGLKGFFVSINSQFSDYIATLGFVIALKSDHIIVDTALGKEELFEFAKTHGGYPEKKITVVRLAIDEKFDSKIPLKKKSKTFKVGYVGSYNAIKNIDMVIRSFKMLRDSDALLELWGKKTIEAELLDKLIEGDKRIQFKGIAPEEEKLKIFDSFDVFVHPGVYESIIQFEALARGLPVIVKRGTKLTDDLKKHCFEARDEAHMAQIIKDLKINGYNEKKREAAIKYARQFTWHKAAVDIVDVYKKVLK